MTKVLAIDIGGTKITYSIIDEKGRFLSEINRLSTPKTKDEVENLFIKLIKEHENEIDIAAFATAGAVNYENTEVKSSTFNMPNGYNTINFKSLSKKPVFVENDANAAAWAEYKIGAAKGEDNCITVTLGTGIGGGFIVDGKLLRGKSGAAGEIGSMKISDRNRICTCSRLNCFEAYASGTGLKTTAEEIALEDVSFLTSIVRHKKPKDVTTYDIIEGVKKHDLYSEMVFNTWKQDLIIGLVNIANIFDPQSIIISGGMGEFINTEEIQNAVNKEIVIPPVNIKLAKTGNYAGMIGTALLACDKFKEIK